VVIDSVSHDGLGIANIGDRPVQIRNALRGETVKARVLRRRKGRWYAEAFDIDDPAAIRTQPPCEHFPRCGGCAMQHLDYQQQVSSKQQLLLEALDYQGVLPERLNPPVTGSRFNYRTKARLGVRVVGGQVLVGFRESFSNRVGRMEACLTLTTELSALLGPLKVLIAELDRPDRVPQVELAAGDVSQALILRHLDQLTDRDQTLIAEFSIRHRVSCFSQSGGYDTVTPVEGAMVKPYLSYANPDFGLHFLFRPVDFTQINLAMNRPLVRAAVSALAAPAGARVLDLFCGIGNFSLALAASGLEVTGLEASNESVVRARMNAERNRVSRRCEFAVRDLYDADCVDPGRATHMLLDPPRSGAGSNLREWVLNGGIERIVYVSCSPKSFSCDAAILSQAGYRLEQVGIFDMFPHTSHVETLGVFQKQW